MAAFPETDVLMELLALETLGMLGSRKGLPWRQEGMERSPCLGPGSDHAHPAHGCHGRLAHLRARNRGKSEPGNGCPHSLPLPFLFFLFLFLFLLPTLPPFPLFPPSSLPFLLLSSFSPSCGCHSSSHLHMPSMGLSILRTSCLETLPTAPVS